MATLSADPQVAASPAGRPKGAPAQATGKVYWAGIVILYASVILFIAIAFLLYLNQTGANPRTRLSQLNAEYLLAAIGVCLALLGVKLVRVGGIAPSDPLPVVHNKEWEILSKAITANHQDPIGEYIRLSSLTGVTGVFTKLGLSGLPLATIGLTIFFALMSVWFGKDNFHELTQLTLGAFIGSFVQRQVAALRESQERHAGDPRANPHASTIADAGAEPNAAAAPGPVTPRDPGPGGGDVGQRG